MLYVNFALGKTRTKKNTKKTLNSAAEKKNMKMKYMEHRKKYRYKVRS